MNMNQFVKKYLPYLLVIVGFVVLAYAYAPDVLQGKIVNQSDISSWRGMANEIIEYNDSHPGDKALWTGSMFSGMPANTIHIDYDGDMTQWLYKFLQTGARPASYLLISLIGGFLLFLAFGTNVWLAALGAIAITFCSYNMQIIQVGHNTKMQAIAFMPWVLAGVVYTYRQKKLLWSLLGGLLFALALSFQIKANHPQITYYLAIVVFGYAVAQMCVDIKNRHFPDFFKKSAILLVTGIIGIATNANHLIPTYEYAQHTMRGGSILSEEDKNRPDGGLDLEYATSWSYGIEETFNLLIPDFNGGASSGALGKDSKTYELLRARYQGADQLIQNMPLYWGPQPFTAGPMYMGAISIFFFILGLLIIKGPVKWWVAAVSLLALLLSWGCHFMWFTELFFKYAPMYNKFRTVSMILVILQITIPVMGILCLDTLFRQDYSDLKSRKKINTAFIESLVLTAGFCLFISIFPSIQGNFSSAADAGLPEDLRNTLAMDRASLRSADAFRSLIFIVLAASAAYLCYMGKLKKSIALGALIVFVTVDLWGVDKRYLNSSHFIRQTQFASQFDPRPVDYMIKQDEDLSYRVLDLTVNTFNDAHTSFHHKTIGGYSAAKLQRYQDLIDYYISPEMSQMTRDLNKVIPQARSIEDLEMGLGAYPVLSMLNTRYVIIDPSSEPLRYDAACGNAWFVDSYTLAATPNEEISLLGLVEPRYQAVLDSTQFHSVLSAEEIAGLENVSDSSSIADRASLNMTLYSPNELKYTSVSDRDGLAVFSEIYYPDGWKAWIDGKETEILRADYALRALYVPAGNHEIVFRYSPDSIRTGMIISYVCSGIILLAIVALICVFVLRKNKNK